MLLYYKKIKAKIISEQISKVIISFIGLKMLKLFFSTHFDDDITLQVCSVSSSKQECKDQPGFLTTFCLKRFLFIPKSFTIPAYTNNLCPVLRPQLTVNINLIKTTQICL